MSLPSTNGKIVLITGINGYIASVLGLDLLKKGYNLRGTSRKVASVERLLKGPYAPYQDRVKIFEVPDMTVDGAFDEASKGVNGIFHIASPVDFALTTYEQTVIPAAQGTKTLLSSALQAGPQLSSVVMTSSVVAVTDPKPDPGYIYTESDFATEKLEFVEKEYKEGKGATKWFLYGASKSAAEKAVWEFKETYKPSFSLTTINPSVVIGPPILLPTTPNHLNETLRPIFSALSGTARSIAPNIGSGSFVDVRDVSLIHIWALEHAEKADGQRYIANEGFGPVQAVHDILREMYEGTKIGECIFEGKKGEGYVREGDFVGYPVGGVKVDGGKAEREVGFRYIGFPESVRDTARALEPLL